MTTNGAKIKCFWIRVQCSLLAQIRGRCRNVSGKIHFYPRFGHHQRMKYGGTQLVVYVLINTNTLNTSCSSLRFANLTEEIPSKNHPSRVEKFHFSNIINPRKFRWRCSRNNNLVNSFDYDRLYNLKIALFIKLLFQEISIACKRRHVGHFGKECKKEN